VRAVIRREPRLWCSRPAPIERTAPRAVYAGSSAAMGSIAARLVIAHADPRAHRPVGHLLCQVGRRRALSRGPSGAKPATPRAFLVPTQRPLDEFTLPTRPSEISIYLRGRGSAGAGKAHRRGLDLFSVVYPRVPLIVRSLSNRQLIVNNLCNCTALRNNPLK
jgi:hypothetical protein